MFATMQEFDRAVDRVKTRAGVPAQRTVRVIVTRSKFSVGGRVAAVGDAYFLAEDEAADLVARGLAQIQP